MIPETYEWKHKPEGWNGEISEEESYRWCDCDACNRNRERDHALWIKQNKPKEMNVKRNLIFHWTVFSDIFRNQLVKLGRPTQFGIVGEGYGSPDNPFVRGINANKDNTIGGEYQMYISPLTGQVIANYTGYDRWYVVETAEEERKIVSQDNFRIVYDDGSSEVKNTPQPFYINKEAYNYLLDGKIVQAVRALRDYRGLGLVEAKNLIDLARGLAIPAKSYNDCK